MRSIVFGVTLLVGASIALAAPAQAADTVTTSDVAPTAWTQVVNPYTAEAPADYNFFADYGLTTEPLTFPFVTPDIVVPSAEGGPGAGFDLAWIAPAPAAGCSRVVNGFSVSITNPTSDSSAVRVALASSGDGLASVDLGTTVQPSTTTLNIPGLSSGFVPSGSAPQTFVATFESPTAWSSDISAILALQGDFDVPHSWTVNSVTFNVTDTCAEAVVVPAEVVTPAAPVAQPALANTGADFTPMGLTAGVLLLGGIAAVGAVAATRRIRNTRP